MVYYNENDPFNVALLRELIADGLIPDGEIDGRSIVDVEAQDVAGFTQCHFFAGIGGWAEALRLAGWPAGRPVWTGSCPCQPFSVAGAKAGGTDPRHLWPHWARLIRECCPVAVVGEQVTAAIEHGWLDLVFDDLEQEGYACGPVCLPAASVGSYQIRDRLWFAASRQLEIASSAERGPGGRRRLAASRAGARAEPSGSGHTCELADADGRNASDGEEQSGRQHGQRASDGGAAWRQGVAERAEAGRMGDSLGTGLEGLAWHGGDGHESRRQRTVPAGSAAASGESSGVADRRRRGIQPEGHVIRTTTGGDEREAQERQRIRTHVGAGGDVEFWSGVEWIPCRDGKWRPVKPGIFPLAHGVPNRVGTLRGAGNAIVPQVAAEVILAFMQSVDNT